MTGWRRPLLIGVGTVVAVIAVVTGVRWWSFYQTHVSTDDAYVRANIAQVTSRVAGTVVDLKVDDNDVVAEGDLIAQLDRAESELRVRESEAEVSRATRLVEDMKGAILTAESRLAVAKAELAQLKLDRSRAEQLAGRGSMPREQLDKARTALQAGEARVEAADREWARAKAALGIPVEAPSQNTAIVRQAVAARDMAALLLSYTEIRAPVAGVIAKRGVEIGQRIQPGQPLMMIVPLAKVYVEANFKETELAEVRVGQPAEIVADVYPGYVYRGHVESLAPASGSAYALLPPENATGNWVKVVQRVPVRIALDEPPPKDKPLRVSLSVLATIDVTGGSKDGHPPEARAERR